MLKLSNRFFGALAGARFFFGFRPLLLGIGKQWVGTDQVGRSPETIGSTCRNTATPDCFSGSSRSCVHEHADASHALALLRARRERPYGSRAAEQPDELAALHSITSSASASTASGTLRPSALAVLRLITSSYLVGACTGRSAGFSPLRMRST